MIRDKVVKALERVKPILQADGGDIDLVDVNEETGVVKVKLVGACSGCPMSTFTLKNSVERIIKEEVPEVTAVDA